MSDTAPVGEDPPVEQRAAPAGDRRRSSWVRGLLRWSGRVYLALGCVEGVGVVLGVVVGSGAFAATRAAWGMAWLLLGAVLISASRLELPAFRSAEMTQSRASIREAFGESYLRWIFAVLFLVQVGAMIFVAIRLIH